MKHRSFLKWPGGKYQVIHHLLSALPKGNRLIEPFVGSGVVFMNTDYPEYLLADSNPDLISLFGYIQRGGTRFIKHAQALFTPENNDAAVYYNLRREFNDTPYNRRRACLFLYLNRHGYNGLCRYNQKNGYNVPFGRYTRPYFPFEEMQRFHLKSQNVEIKRIDFAKTFKLAQPGDIIYCDPPYAPRHQQSNFSAYTQQGFDLDKQAQLADLARKLTKRGVTTVISNHDTPYTRALYEGTNIQSFQVNRFISRNIHERMPVGELLATFR